MRVFIIKTIPFTQTTDLLLTHTRIFYNLDSNTFTKDNTLQIVSKYVVFILPLVNADLS
jgi:hypothetical protein